MWGVLVNGGSIFLGAILGKILGHSIKEKTQKSIMQAMGLVVITIGISGVVKAERFLILIASLALGTLLGEWLAINEKIANIGFFFEKRLKGNRREKNIVPGFVTGTIIYCSGAMAIVGAIESGIYGSHKTLFTKAIIDGITAIFFTTTFGIGVAFSAVSVMFYQGGIVILSHLAKYILTEPITGDMSVVGSVLILAIGLNILEVTDIPVANMIPSILLPIALHNVGFLLM